MTLQMGVLNKPKENLSEYYDARRIEVYPVKRLSKMEILSKKEN